MGVACLTTPIFVLGTHVALSPSVRLGPSDVRTNLLSQAPPNVAYLLPDPTSANFVEIMLGTCWQGSNHSTSSFSVSLYINIIIFMIGGFRVELEV